MPDVGQILQDLIRDRAINDGDFLNSVAQALTDEPLSSQAEAISGSWPVWLFHLQGKWPHHTFGKVGYYDILSAYFVMAVTVRCPELVRWLELVFPYSSWRSFWPTHKWTRKNPAGKQWACGRSPWEYAKNHTYKQCPVYNNYAHEQIEPVCLTDKWINSDKGFHFVPYRKL